MAPQQILGGLRQRGVQDCLKRFDWALSDARRRRRPIIAASEDLANCYDSVDRGQSLAIMEALGAPKNVLRVVSSFYDRCQRVFCSGRHVSQEWTRGRHGLIQGCPFSALMLAGVMSAWVEHSSVGLEGVIVYLDDRTYWSGGEEGPRRIQKAGQRSVEVDRRFGLYHYEGKGQTATDDTQIARRLKDMRVIRGCIEDHIEIVGVHYFLKGDRAPRLKKDIVDRVTMPCNLICYVSRSATQRARLMRVLVAPIYAWAGAHVEIPESVIKGVRRGVAAAVQGNVAISASRAIMSMAGVPHDLDPKIATTMAAFRIFSSSVRQRFVEIRWQQDLPLDFLFADPVSTMPAMRKIIKELGMQWGPANFVLQWSDSVGRSRQIHIGHEGESSMLKVAVEQWSRQQVHNAERVRKSYHRRDEPGAAVGLDLAAPVGRGVLVTEHRMALLNESGGGENNRAVVLGASPSFWHSVPESHTKPEDKAQCMCGLDKPSRQHLLWTCAATRGLREKLNVEAPTGRCEERLLIPSLEEKPPPIRHPVQGTTDRIAKYVSDAVVRENRAVIVIATDGGANADGASWAVVVRDQGSASGGLPYEEHKAFLAELHAALMCTEAVAEAAKG